VIARTGNDVPVGTIATEDTAPGGQGRSLLAVPDRVRLAMWRNEGHGILTDVTVRAGLDELWVLPSRPLIADFDQDGDLDLACVGAENQVHLLWNRGEATNRRLVCELVDARRPSRAFGAHVQAYAGRRVMQSAPSSGRVSLGIGTLEQLDVLCVRWADGYVQNILSPERLVLDRRQTVSVVRIERDAAARR